MDLQKKIIPFTVFFVVANPATFKVTRKLGGWVASPEGLPKMGGLLLHALVFVILSHLLWKIFYGGMRSNAGTPTSAAAGTAGIAAAAADRARKATAALLGRSSYAGRAYAESVNKADDVMGCD